MIRHIRSAGCPDRARGVLGGTGEIGFMETKHLAWQDVANWLALVALVSVGIVL